MINIEWDGNVKMPPCTKDCPQRSATCHGQCKGYKDYRAAKDAETEKRNIERAGMYATHDRIITNARLKKAAKHGGVKSI